MKPGAAAAAARYAAQLLSPREFQVLCSYLDAKYRYGIKFQLISVMRVGETVTEVVLELDDNRKVTLNEKAFQ